MNFGTFDIETYGSLEAPFKFGVCFEGGDFEVFTNKKDMLDFMLKSGLQLWYSHNLEFDLSKLLGKKIFTKGEYFIYDKGLLFYKIIGENGETEFRDSVAILPLPLKKLGAKQSTPLKLLKEDYIHTQSIEYCVFDCAILYKKINEFLDEIKDIRNNLSHEKKRRWKKIPYTIASISLKIQKELGYHDHIYYFNKRKKHKVPYTTVKQFNKHFNQSYYGGRTENFIIGHVDNAHIYDINSMYPAMMKKPIPLQRFMVMERNPGIKKIINSDVEGCAKIKGVQKGFIPVLPVRTEKVYFPVGKIEGVYNINEIRYAVETGYLDIQNINWAVYTDKFFNFERLINSLYGKRIELKKSDDNRQIFYKLLLNSGYGKYAQKIIEKEYLQFTDVDDFLDYIFENDITDSKNHQIFTNMLRIYINKENDEPTYKKHSCLSIASYITSYARIELHRSMQKLYKKGFEVYYCDTDSIFTDCKLKDFKKLFDVDKFKLGYWDYEGEYSLDIRACKYYKKQNLDENIIKIKGVKNPKDFSNKHKQTQYYKFKTAFRENTQLYTVRDMKEYKELKWWRNQKRDFDDLDYLYESHKDIDLTPAVELNKYDYQNANKIKNKLEIGYMQALNLLRLVKKLGFEHDNFHWDKLVGGDLTYGELKTKIYETTQQNYEYSPDKFYDTVRDEFEEFIKSDHIQSNPLTVEQIC